MRLLEKSGQLPTCIKEKQKWPAILIVLLPCQVPLSLSISLSLSLSFLLILIYSSVISMGFSPWSFSGGYGTLEELLEVITWAQLGIHDKPVSIPNTLWKDQWIPFFSYSFNGQYLVPYKQVGLLNVDGYYNSLLTFIDKAVDDGFIKPSQRHIIVSAPNAKELVQKLEVGHLLFFLFGNHIWKWQLGAWWSHVFRL